MRLGLAGPRPTHRAGDLYSSHFASTTVDRTHVTLYQSGVCQVRGIVRPLRRVRSSPPAPGWERRERVVVPLRQGSHSAEFRRGLIEVARIKRNRRYYRPTKHALTGAYMERTTGFEPATLTLAR